MIIPLVMYMEQYLFTEEPGIKFPLDISEVLFSAHSHIYGWMPIVPSNRNHYMTYAISNYISIVFYWMTVLKFFQVCHFRDEELTDEGKNPIKQ